MKLAHCMLRQRRVAATAAVALALVLCTSLTGCGSNERNAPAAGAAVSGPNPIDGSNESPLPQRTLDDAVQNRRLPEETALKPSQAPSQRSAAQIQDPNDRLDAVEAAAVPHFAPPPAHDEKRLAAEGIGRVASRRLVLYSDLPAQKLAGLGEAVDQLFDEWVDYFFVDEGAEDESARKDAVRNALADWKVTGYLMADADLFRRVGLLPAEVGSFPNARSRVIVQRDAQDASRVRVSRMEFWMHDQKEDYYRRHLLLHEATHCFVDSVVGKPDATWYAEGIAELFATHVPAVVEGDATRRTWRFRAMPADNDQVPGWGRIPLIQEAVEQNRALSAAGVRHAPANEFLETQWYAWCWALATFLDNHPRYRARFRGLPLRRANLGLDESFDRRFRDDALELEEQWQVFVANLEYGYDVRRTAMDLDEGRPLEAGSSVELPLAADRGWQNTAVRLEPGRRYRVRARGRFSLAEQPKTWWCEPQGVSFRYYQGKPLGRLVGAVRSAEAFRAGGTSSLLDVLDLGQDATLVPPQAGTLFLRLNDAWGELSDNRGQVEVTIQAVP